VSLAILSAHLDRGKSSTLLGDVDCRTGILLATTIIYSYIEIATKEGTPGLAGMADILG